MKGYKASINRICRDQLYEVGQTYKINGNLQICKNGYHFCGKIDDVLIYYPTTQELVIFEVEALGEVITEGNKSVTDEIKIVREIPVTEWNNLFQRYKFDERKNLIYKKTSPFYEWDYIYDENNNKIYQKDSYGDEWHYKYDENNNMIYSKNPDGKEWYWKYNKNNNLIYQKDSYGDELYNKYDENNNLIFYKNIKGDEWHWKYDKNNNWIYKKNSFGNEFHYKYDKNNKLI